MRRVTTLLLATVLSIVSGGMRAAPASPPTVIVELFTSEGCSDCPPADALLNSLLAAQPIAGVEIIGLDQHVDYWDRQGWKDRFSSAALTARQQAYQTRFNTSSIYTPQMVVDGRAEFVGSDAVAARRAIERSMASPHGTIRITLDDDTGRPVEGRVDAGRPIQGRDRSVDVGRAVEGRLDVARPFQGRDRRVAQGKPDGARRVQVSVSVADLPRPGRGDRADLIVAVTESGLRTDVTRGENHGRTLTHAAVVRHMATIGHVAADGSTSASARAEIPIAADWRLDHLTIVAFVQEIRGGTILASASVPVKSVRR